MVRSKLMNCVVVVVLIGSIGSIALEVQAIGPKIKYAPKKVTQNPQEPSVLHQVPASRHATRVTPTPARLFYNYYAPTQGGGIPAGIYPAPRQVPLVVGHTYNTYQPLMPHEFMYRHNRAYHHYYNNGMGFTRTSVRYR
ncbi:MAG: hypothetical protein HN617_09105 [Planctomycetaceae bacterium]|jgi:hypothetical protein|nr:hypothetical protein [Planctomycetaceae bacterium]MBT4013010.1 hypothetical protein [Planctomycetaceae bacterium]MBT4723696.1 hypothetical protein [Planctomycetaceae bacterium]MBT4847292.1 hypothetical protein [Planctomycetaceae bacterium]MBT5125557.1 hypothetical protein [Planctomycetaceae bacterium]